MQERSQVRGEAIPTERDPQSRKPYILSGGCLQRPSGEISNQSRPKFMLLANKDKQAHCPGCSVRR